MLALAYTRTWIDAGRPMDAEAHAWASREVAAAGLGEPGAFEPVKVRAWAAVYRAPTPSGFVYFKANAPGGRHEPALTTALAQAWPDDVPAPLATDPQRGWMLTRDCGQRMNDALDEPAQREAWTELLPRYAEIQLESAREPERWLALGVPDRRLAHLPALAAALVTENADLDDDERAQMLELVPALETSCHALAGTPAPATLEHGDLHAANILVGADRFWLFDWADASVSHPFCTLLVHFDMMVEDIDAPGARETCAPLLDAYLAPFTRLAPKRSLRPLVSTALWVAHVGRALDWAHMLAGTNTPDRADWEPNIAVWLQRWLERKHWMEPGAWP